METRRVDVAVIGAGTAGLNARRQAERAGASTLLIEAGPYGTTCARVGCMPSKLLIAAAQLAHDAGRAAAFGVNAGPVRIDGAAVLRRLRRERDRFAGAAIETTERIPETLRLRGRARFVAPTALEVDAHTRVEARAIVIATGSSPLVPRGFETLGDALLTNETVFELEQLPESVGIVGTGVIALELGQALHRLGVRTILFGRSAGLGPISDPAVQRSMLDVFGKELDLRLAVEVDAQRDGDACRVRWKRAADGRSGEERVQRVIAAAGRRPNLADLQLEKAGIQLAANGSPVFDPRTLQCGRAPIFLAGDASGDRPFLHEAADEGRIAGGNAARWPEVTAARRRTPLAIVFTDPEIALVGKRLDELDERSIEIGEVFYEDQGRAQVMGLNAGLVRVYANRECGQLLGAEMFGPRVEHTAHLLAWSIQQGLTVQEALENPFYHPVIEEGIQTALRDLAAQLKCMPPLAPLECGPGH